MRLGSWLNSLQSRVSRQIHPTERRIRRRRSTPVSHEINELETRTLLAAVSWDGSGGDFQWTNAANWNNDDLPGVNNDIFPGVNDDVTINFGSNNFTVVHESGTDYIHSLTSSASLNVSGGELYVSATSSIQGDLSLSATFGGSGNISVSGLFKWTTGGGRTALRGANGQGSLTVLSDSTLNSNGAVADFTLINAATMIWNGGTVQFYGNTSRFINLEGATFDDQIDGAFGRHCRAARTMTV